MSINNVGERIKILRKERNLTLKSLSEKSNISVSFLSDIENGRSHPSLEKLNSIANALNISTSYLLDENRSEVTLSIKDEKDK